MPLCRSQGCCFAVPHFLPAVAVSTTHYQQLLAPPGDWGKLLGDAAAVSAMLDRLLHHGHVLKCGQSRTANPVGRF
jgi:hypothetical protein